MDGWVGEWVRVGEVGGWLGGWVRWVRVGGVGG